MMVPRLQLDWETGTGCRPVCAAHEEHSMTYSLEDKGVLIVGGSSDIAQILVDAGWSVR
jgi:hypothetical protein